jgi:ABC-2 type transport system permease protein
MREALAMTRASWLAAASYRLGMVFSVVGLLVAVVPLYFVADALQPVVAEAIAGEGRQYFGFLVVGTLAFSFLATAVTSLPGAIGSGIRTGTLEALLTTPVRLPTLLAGLTLYDLLWTAARAALLLAFGWALGAQIAWQGLLLSLGVLALIVLAYLPFGLVAAALVLAFRTAGPLPQVVLVVSGLLGGVYYPTHVIPSWIRVVSDAVPLTYGLRALRRTLLEGASLRDVAGDLTMLVALTAGLMAVGAVALRAGMRHARRSGTLARY